MKQKLQQKQHKRLKEAQNRCSERASIQNRSVANPVNNKKHVQLNLHTFYFQLKNIFRFFSRYSYGIRTTIEWIIMDWFVLVQSRKLEMCVCVLCVHFAVPCSTVIAK